MFHLGEYDEESAEDIKSYLDDASLKVEAKPCLVMEEETTFTIKDRLSAIKDMIDYADQFESYLSALRSVLPRATQENFEELFLRELDPLIMEKRDRIIELSKNPESFSPEERETLKFSSEEWISNALFISKASTFAGMVMSQNDIKIGEPLENKLDDPVVEIEVDPDDYETMPENINCAIEFYLEKAVNLFVDEFTTPLACDLDEEFWDAYPSEAHRLKVLGLLIEKLATSPPSNKMDFSQFAEECTIHIEDEGSALSIHGKDVAEDLARVLEKSGIVKWKGDRLKWKSMD